MNAELILLSVVSGLFAAFSPCNIPVYPVLLNMLAKNQEGRRKAAFAFAAGMTLTFTSLYLPLLVAIKLVDESVLGKSLEVVYTFVYVLAALVCLLFALQTMGKINFWGRTIGFPARLSLGARSAFATGGIFATVISPCNIPFIMTPIVTFLSGETSIFEGLLRLFLFSASMSLPILLFGVFSTYAMNQHVKHNIPLIEKASAVFLVLAAGYFISLAAAIQ